MAVEKPELETAIEEAERFLRRARLLLPHLDAHDSCFDPGNGNPTRASMLRASLDLSMALAKLRGR